jgi:alkylated DNA repair dioxygenase AlkB
MSSLFGNTPIEYNLPQANLVYYPSFFNDEAAVDLLKKLKNEIHWQEENIVVFGKTHLQPRLTAFYSDAKLKYGYSGIQLKTNDWSPLLLKIKYFIENETGLSFNAVLLNWYRNGKDSNGWHADNEKELGQNPVVASVSFGAERKFQFKHNTQTEEKHNLILQNGSLLVMKGEMQHYWKHQIPKTTQAVGNRINLTFRTIF